MDRLKNETWPLHQSAESGALEQDLVKGALPCEVFSEQLGQRYLVHKQLESKLAEACLKDARVAAIITSDHFHSHRAASDLQYFAYNVANLAPMAATARFLQTINASGNIALLGIEYVLEGSTNGARYIALALRKAWNLPGTEGTTYLDPYGDQQREKWAAFKTAMNTMQFTDDEAAQMIEAAKSTFRFVIDLEADLYPKKAQV